MKLNPKLVPFKEVSCHLTEVYLLFIYYPRSRKTSVSKQKEPSETSHGWNLYVISTVSTLQLYREMVHFKPDLIMLILLKRMSITVCSPNTEKIPICSPNIHEICPLWTLSTDSCTTQPSALTSSCSVMVIWWLFQVGQSLGGTNGGRNG